MLDGWLDIDRDFVAGAAAGEGLAADLRRFFDGAEPDWRHAVAPGSQVPRRRLVGDTVAVLCKPFSHTMVLLIGPAGEGKSTALRQVAVDLARDNSGERLRVLFRPPGARLDPDAVAGLPEGAHWVLAIDDAEELAQDIEKAVERLFDASRRDVHWLLATRDADWEVQFPRGGGGRSVEPAWERLLSLWPPRALREQTLVLSDDDGAKLVRAWQEAGCLGALESVPEEDRAAAVVEASQRRQGLSDATLFGAVVELRFGPEGLAAHVQAAVSPRLDTHRGTSDAFLYAAVAGAVGIDGIDLRVAAHLLGIDPADRVQIRADLGREGLGTGSGEALRARHPAMARAAVDLLGAGRLPGRDLETVFRELVRGTGEVSRRTRPLVSDGPIMTCAPMLAGRLQQLGVPPDRAGRVARAAADEAAAALDNLLVMMVSRGRTYRTTGHGDEAVDILRAALPEAPGKEDWDMAGRSLLYELGVCAADAGRPAEQLVLAALSIADVEGIGPVSLSDGRLALAAVGAARAALGAEAGAEPVFQRLLRGLSYLGRRVTPNWDTRLNSEFKRYGAMADELGISECSSAQACQYLADAVAAANGLVQDDERLVAAELLGGATPTFAELKRTVDR